MKNTDHDRSTITAGEYQAMMKPEAQKMQDALKAATSARTTVSKYRNQKVTATDGDTGQSITFDSKAEHAYYQNLLLRKRAGEITSFSRQVKYSCSVGGELICVYIADFVLTYPDGRQEVVDVKGVETPVFILKKKLMRVCNHIEILIVKK